METPVPHSVTGVRRISMASLLLAAPVVVWVYYLCGQYIFDEDRPFHTAYLVNSGPYLIYNGTEILWGLLAPRFGEVFPDFPFEAFVMFSALLGLVAFYRLTGSILLTLGIVLSLGAIELINESARQGFAAMLFVLALTLPWRWPLAIATCFIHTVTFTGLAFIAVSWVAERFADNRYLRQAPVIALAVTGAIVVYTFLSERVVESALLLVIVQGAALLWMRHTRQPNYDTIMVGIAFSIAAMFFIGTSTGIRGIYEMAVVAPFVMGRTGLSLTIGGLWVYPILLQKFDNLAAFGPHLLDFLWAIH